jgi:hypothetical protein
VISYEDAGLCLLVLTSGSTYGWDDTSRALYLDTFQRWDDAHALADACRQVITGWTHAHKPPIGDVKAAYDSIMRRKSMATGEIGPSPDSYPTFEEGVEIARQAYHAECYRLGKNPNEDLFNSFLGIGREERKAAERAKQAKRG